MKKIVFLITAISLIVMAACTNGSSETPDLMSKNEEVLSFQALAAASLLPASEDQVIAPLSYSSYVNIDLNETEEELDDTDALVDTIEPYIALVEKFLSTDNGLSVQVELSNLEDYNLMMTFQTKGLLGETQVYIIHYNMTLEDEDDDESEFSLEGIMLFNDQIYVLTGEREVEEDEEKIEFIAKLDDLNYIESEYKIESDEIEYEIKVVLNGEVVSETKIEIKYEEDETKIELEFIQGESKGTYEFTYELEDGQPILKIEFDVEINGMVTKGEIVVSIHLDEITGETYYRLFVEDEEGNGYERNVSRKIDDDDDEEDSDPSDYEEDEDDSDADETQEELE